MALYLQTYVCLVHLVRQKKKKISMSLANGMEKEMAAHSSVLAGESQGQESLLGCCLRGRRVGHN